MDQPLIKTDGRKANGGARPNAGRKKLANPSKRKNTTVSVDPVVAFKARSRHGSLAKALEFAAINGGKG